MASDLIKDLDEAAAHILKRAQGGNKEDPITLSEQVRAFDSMAKYAELRLKLKPPKKTEGAKFMKLKGQLNGNRASIGAGDTSGEEADA